jgi:peptide/nickel transport system permease protein/oligopeptide transport system permease protein
MANDALISRDLTAQASSEHSHRHEVLKQIARIAPARLLKMALTLLVIVFLTQFLLIMADRGRNGLPAAPETAVVEAVQQTVDYLFNHPATYYLHKQNLPTSEVVLDAFVKSAGLLLFALGLATLIGVPLGIVMALSRRNFSRVLMLLTSVLLTSLPSFLLAMLLWIVNIQAHQRFRTPQLPITGFGWGAHIVLPALVLMARPLAQIAQVTYVTMQDVMRQDFIRVAYAKGFRRSTVVDRHALKNTLIPVMTTMGASLRFSLASLPIVESFFIWPGVGLLLLESIRLGYNALTTDLIVSLGFLFLLLNLLLDFVYPLIDARLRDQGGHEEHEEHESWRNRLRDWRQSLADGFGNLRNRVVHPFRKRPPLPPLPVDIDSIAHSPGSKPERSHKRGWLLGLILHNGPLLIGLLLLSVMLILVFYGDHLTTSNPYQTHGVLMIEGKIAAPPFKPSTQFPWGSDVVGRDVQALVLWGARQTLALALFGMVARVLLGTFLGALAGWRPGSGFDRVVTGGIDVWAAFPVTIFAALLIQAIGIQQGTWVFIVALAVVGWGEVAQFVRSKVIAIRPQPYIEAAKSIGVQSGRMLSRHIFPNLLASLVVLAALEMGSVLMLLAELGYLNIFLGGGFRAEVGEVGRMQAVVYYFSDIPEWGALLANIRNWWRSYPWMVWYAGLAFFMAIVTFNILAEGLRRFLDESRVNVGRVINRYTALAAVAAGLIWVLWSTAPVGQYGDVAQQFDAARVLADIQALSSSEMAGRETGTSGAKAAADYIEKRMREIGLQPAGSDPGYLQEFPCPRVHLTETPVMEIVDRPGITQSLKYRGDFAEHVGYTNLAVGELTGPIVGLALGPVPDKPGADPYGLRQLKLDDKIVVIREAQAENFNTVLAGGTLVVIDDPRTLQRRHLYAQSGFARPSEKPIMYITPEVAERLLATAGSSLGDLDRKSDDLGVGESSTTAAGTAVHLKVAAEMNDEDVCYNITGSIPGTAAGTTTGITQALNSQVILISAYYDGLGVGPDGALYAGANDNASGVAAMLEMARVLKQSPYAPKKTIVFSAWSGGERNTGFSVKNVMNAKKGFGLLTVEAVLELSGMGAGSGDAIQLGEGSSYRLVQLFQTAASRLGHAVTTRGRDPHFGLPTQVGFGGRSGLTLNVSWDGSDATAHTPQDAIESIDLEKLRKSGQTTMLTLLVLSRETDY